MAGKVSPGSMRVIFMGTPEFAVASLEALLHAGVNIVAVVTAPDKPAGRGMKLTESAVKKFAVEHELKVLQPEKLRDPQLIESLHELKADLQVVVAFRMLPEIVWNMPPLGTINLHGSLLPQYRGAAPINWAIINGERITGVTTFKLQHAIDTGNILLSDIIPIGEEETAGELHDRMKMVGAALLAKTVLALQQGELRDIPQESSGDIKHAPKIFTETCRIDWNKPVDEVFNLIRGLSPYPGAFTYFNEKILKIFRAKREYNKPAEAPGEYTTDRKSFLKFACADGYIHCEEIQLEGKKKMKVDEFLRGLR